MEGPLNFITYALLGLANLLSLKRRDYLIGTALAAGIFIVFGTILGAWLTPLALRATELDGSDLWLLGAESAVLGLFFALRERFVGARFAGAGILFTVFALICPICGSVFDTAFGEGFLIAQLGHPCFYAGLFGISVSIIALLWRSASIAFQQLAQDDGLAV